MSDALATTHYRGQHDAWPKEDCHYCRIDQMTSVEKAASRAALIEVLEEAQETLSTVLEEGYAGEICCCNIVKPLSQVTRALEQVMEELK